MIFSPDASGYGFMLLMLSYGFFPDASGYDFMLLMLGYDFPPYASGWARLHFASMREQSSHIILYVDEA